MITYSDFTVDFPEFADATKYSQVRVERAIARASTQVDNELALASELISYLAAHILVTSTPNTSAGGATTTGAVASLSVAGEYSVTYAKAGSSSGGNSLSSTSYGQRFLELLSSLSLTPVVV